MAGRTTSPEVLQETVTHIEAACVAGESMNLHAVSRATPSPAHAHPTTIHRDAEHV